MIFRKAEFSEHKEIMQLARHSKYTRDFSNHIFSGEAMYDKGWINVAEMELSPHPKVVGFYCVRHKVRTPATTLYFIGVDEEYKDLKIGTDLLQHMKDNSPYKCIELNCMKDNEPALKFYEKHKFQITGESLKGKGVHMELRW